MTTGRAVPRIPIQLSRGVLVASVQVDLDEAVLTSLRDDLLARIHASGAAGVILDLSGLETLDSYEFEALRSLMVMTRMMGARTVLVGLKPGIVAALILTEVDVEGIDAALDLDAAFRMLEPEPEPEPEVAEAAEPVQDEELAEPGAPS